MSAVDMSAVDWTLLIRAATRVRTHAYAPYSKYRVGAALLSRSGAIFVGCNVENASYGLSLCAERSAVAGMVANGHRAFRAIAIVTDGQKVGPPCGMCRQVLFELSPHALIGLAHPRASRPESIVSVASLLPEAFGREALSSRKSRG